jgi:ankyrin repeat protein
MFHVGVYNACQYEDVDEVKRILRNIRTKDSYNAAINWASGFGKIDIVKYLLLEGCADPTNDKNSAIRRASINGHADIVSLLLQDERVDPTDDYNYASIGGHTKVVELLLQDGRVDPAIGNDYAIRLAATQEIKDMLIAYKYRVDGKEYCRLKDNLSKN